MNKNWNALVFGWDLMRKDKKRWFRGEERERERRTFKKKTTKCLFKYWSRKLTSVSHLPWVPLPKAHFSLKTTYKLDYPLVTHEPTVNGSAQNLTECNISKKFHLGVSPLMSYSWSTHEWLWPLFLKTNFHEFFKNQHKINK